MLSIQLQAPTPARPSRFKQTTFICAAAFAGLAPSSLCVCAT
ncbi:hypothetical protein PSH58_21675 [Pseudomonas hefeiensis]|uniref:Uncharacterized protein n=1 Tax=Pseudomonas hefeiensis TaxID=2738125 RepID=A0ABY9G764_9PSED|nr:MULTISPECIES: hypothetical protein [unclassified Pseudomonas]WLH11441.1 hypothetical protein PSH57_21640 [Pseudomonas sp. FP205]WLH94510.1 hypothetical protein PSH58_21675 [Pseudomonas sp. FP53]WLI38791.1 hypothetical protein PSH74_21620 [Pseudomonas sp. FP821]